MTNESCELIRDLGGGVLDNRKLDRIDNNAFILNDGVLPVCDDFKFMWMFMLNL